MSNDTILHELNLIKSLLKSLNNKIDNFLGFEELNPNEKDELEKLRKEMNNGESCAYDDVFEGPI